MVVEVLVVTPINHKVTGILLVVDIVRFTLEVINYAPTSGNTGGGGSHNHGFTNPNFNLNVAYTDVIIGQKN